jgi:hypothetical protein
MHRILQNLRKATSPSLLRLLLSYRFHRFHAADVRVHPRFRRGPRVTFRQRSIEVAGIGLADLDILPTETGCEMAQKRARELDF